MKWQNDRPTPQDPDQNERGQGLVEYALILVLVAVVAAVAMQMLGGSVQSVFSEIAQRIDGSATTSIPDCGPYATWYPDPGYCGE